MECEWRAGAGCGWTRQRSLLAQSGKHDFQFRSAFTARVHLELPAKLKRALPHAHHPETITTLSRRRDPATIVHNPQDELARILKEANRHVARPTAFGGVDDPLAGDPDDRLAVRRREIDRLRKTMTRANWHASSSATDRRAWRALAAPGAEIRLGLRGRRRARAALRPRKRMLAAGVVASGRRRRGIKVLNEAVTQIPRQPMPLLLRIASISLRRRTAGCSQRPNMSIQNATRRAPKAVDTRLGDIDGATSQARATAANSSAAPAKEAVSAGSSVPVCLANLNAANAISSAAVPATGIAAGCSRRLSKCRFFRARRSGSGAIQTAR